MKNFSREELDSRLLEEFVEDEETEEGGEAEESQQNSHRAIKIMVSLIAVAVLSFAVYAWRSDKIAISRNSGEEARLIKADTSPLRVKPEDPGGMYIANRDKQVYDAISSSADDEKVINVLPVAEEPVSRDALSADPLEPPVAIEATAAQPAKEPVKEVAAAVPTAAPTPAPAPVKEEVAKPTEVAVAKPKQEVVVKQELMSKDVKVEAPTPAPVHATTTTKPAAKNTKALTVDDIKMVKSKETKTEAVEEKKTSSAYKVQLGSFRSEEDVKTTWAKIKKDHPDLFKGAQLHTEKADLGEKGVFYRLQVGGIKKESDARKICQKLNDAKQGCFVVKK
jgi:cell division septation protein DedD